MADNFKLIWNPEGGSRREWSFNMGKPPWDVLSITEKATDWPWAQFQDRLENGSGLAMQALLWVLRKRDEPKLAMASVIPDFDEIEFEMQCPDCKTWVHSEDDVEHVCVIADDEEPAEATPGEAKRSSRKSSDTAPGSSTS